jgi:uncharacterized protein YdaU (DUF1376 family)
MSRAWMPLYVGDYLRDTGHLTTEQHGAYMLMLMHVWQHDSLPADEIGRAAVARVPLKQWKAIRTAIEAFFQPDGTHKRVKEEAAKAERKLLQRQMAGQKGGMKSGVARAVRMGEAIRDHEARSKQKGSERFVPAEASDPAKTKPPRTNHKEEVIKTFTVSGVEGESYNPGGSLASALPAGALARPPLTELIPATAFVKRPSELTRAELDAMIGLRKATA